MTEVYRRKPQPPDWPRPDGVTVRDIDAATGRLPSSACMLNIVTEYFVAGMEPQTTCIDTPVQPFDSSGRAKAMRDTTNPFRIPPR